MSSVAESSSSTHSSVCVQLGMVGYGGCCKGEKKRACGGFDAEGRQGERMSGFLPKGHRAGPSHWIPGSTLLKRSSGLTADGSACFTCRLSSHSEASTFGPRMLQLPWSRSRVPCIPCHPHFPYRLISHSSRSLSTLQHVAPAGTPSCSPTLPHSSIICFLIYSFHH